MAASASNKQRQAMKENVVRTPRENLVLQLFKSRIALEAVQKGGVCFTRNMQRNRT